MNPPAETPRAWRSRPDRGVTWVVALGLYAFGLWSVAAHAGPSLAWALAGFGGGAATLRLWQTRPWRRRGAPPGEPEQMHVFWLRQPDDTEPLP